VQEQPDLAGVNTRYAGVNWYRHHLGELKTVQATQTRKEPSAVGHG
jgi:spore coat polysaccharide biosynthesis protein SpsF